MNKIEIFSDPPIDWIAWNKVNQQNFSFLQSESWADILINVEKAIPNFIRFYSKGRLVAQCLLMKRFYFNRFTRRKKFILPYFECIHGPIFLKDISHETVEFVYKEMTKLAYKNFATHIIITPPYYNHGSQYYTNYLRMLDFNVTNWGTYLVSLEPSLSEINQKVSPKVRNKVKKAQKMGVRVEKIASYEDFKFKYNTAFNEIKGKNGFVGEPANKSQWTFGEIEGYHYYLAYKDDLVLGCIGMLNYNGVATEVGSCISPEAIINKYPAQDLLHWHLITEAKMFGAKVFDLSGINPNPSNSKEAGILSFKKKWGGDLVDYGIATKNLIPFKVYFAAKVKQILSYMV